MTDSPSLTAVQYFQTTMEYSTGRPHRHPEQVNTSHVWTILHDVDTDDPSVLKYPAGEYLKTERQEQLFKTVKKSNQVCSPLFAVFVPVNPFRASDVFLPMTVHYAGAAKLSPLKKGACVLGSLTLDIVTLPFRLLTAIPRLVQQIWYGFSIMSTIRPIDRFCSSTTAHDLISENPGLVVFGKKRLFVSRFPMHEIDARRYFESINPLEQYELPFASRPPSIKKFTIKTDKPPSDSPASSPDADRYIHLREVDPSNGEYKKTAEEISDLIHGRQQ